MPAGYEKIKAKLLDKGYSLEAAKEHAAKIWNSVRPAGVAPVTRNYDKPDKPSK